MYEAIEKDNQRSKPIWYGVNNPISAIAVHPHQTIIAVSTDDGEIGIFDYANNFDRKALVIIEKPKDSDNKKDDSKKTASQLPSKRLRAYMTEAEKQAERQARAESRIITCMQFTPSEGELLIGCSWGEIKVIDGDEFKLQEQKQNITLSE